MNAQKVQAATAAQLLLDRREARRSMSAWSRLCGFEPAKHHSYLIRELEAVVRGEINRLAIFLPPGSAKSTYASVLFPPWFLAQKPNSAILVCSHSADLAESFGRRSRNLIIDKEKVLGYSLTEDSQAAGKWATTNGGEFFCAGVGGRIAGRRADLALIDDPVGSKEDAYSEVSREHNWSWFNFDFRTRLKPNAPVVLVQTRWHEDDLAGRILAKEGSEWTVINIPLIALQNDPIGRLPGEVLWPEYFNDKLVSDARKDVDVFQCLYQQDPIPESGDFFKREWLDGCGYGSYAELPGNLRYYCGSDHAVRTEEVNDPSALIPVGVDSNDDIWVLPDVFWDRADAGAQVDAMLEIMKRRKPLAWYAGKDHITGSIGPFLHKRMREERTYVYVHELPNHNRRKRELAMAIQGRMKMGKVHWPHFAHWWPLARREMLSFDAGKHDDFVDALACVGRGLNEMIGSEPPPQAEKEHQPPDLSALNVKWLRESDKWNRGKRERLMLMDN